MEVRDRPLLYVITINYNSAIHTVEMVNNLQQSSYDNIRVIVVDNCSSPDDRILLEELADKAQIIASEDNLGFAGGNNLGINLALQEGADYVLLLNNDTTVEKDALDVMIECLVKEQANVICPKILNYYDRDLIYYAGGDIIAYKGGVRIDGLGKVDCGQYDDSRQITFAHGCCMLLEASTIKEVGLLSDEYFLYFEDTDYSSRLTKQGKKMMYCPGAIIYHKESVSTKKYSANYQYYFCRNRLLFVQRNIAFPIKYLAYLYSLLYMLKHLAKRDFQLANITSALQAFGRKRLGQR